MSAEQKEAFFNAMRESCLALTFDDVRLRTGRSHVPAGEVDITSQFSTNVELKTPIVSAAMDTVTGSDMAIAVAKLGGIGVVHAAMEPHDQRREVRRVKLHLNGMIEEPVCVREEDTLSSVLAMCDQKRYDFRTFPVLDVAGRFAGLLTQNDFDFGGPASEQVGRVMTPVSEVLHAPQGTTVQEAYGIMRDCKKKTLPLLDEAGKVAGLYVFSDVRRIVAGDSGQYNVDASGRLRVAAAVPTGATALERVDAMRQYADVMVLDTAQGDSDFAINTLRELKHAFPDVDVVIGNVSEAASARELAQAGADGIKVGQGPGSICTTRIETGIGTPQVTAVYECARAVREFGIPVCADGGVRSAGDLSIAIAAGAYSVMMGSRLAGTDEAPGDIIVQDDGVRVMRYRAMGSPSALRDSAASRERYGVVGGGEPLAEGVESLVPYQGSVARIIGHYIKALRKSMTYVGAATLDQHRQETGFIRITNAGLRESHPHDVHVFNG